MEIQKKCFHFLSKIEREDYINLVVIFTFPANRKGGSVSLGHCFMIGCEDMVKKQVE